MPWRRYGIGRYMPYKSLTIKVSTIMGLVLLFIAISGKLLRWLFLPVDVSVSSDMANYWLGQQFICNNEGYNAYYYGRTSELILPFIMKGVCLVGFNEVQTYGYFWALTNWLFYSISVAYLLATLGGKWMWKKNVIFAVLSFLIVIYPVGNGIQLLRQSLSIIFAVLFFATYFRYRKSILTFLFAGIAALTHVQSIISILQFWIFKINLKYYLFFITLSFIFYIALTNILGQQLSHYHPIFDRDLIGLNKISPSLLGSVALMIMSILSKSRHLMFFSLMFAGFTLIVPNDFQRLFYGVDFLFLPLILIIFLARVRNLHFYLIISAILIGYGEFFSVLLR
jgi:hypothetical protein